MSKIALFLLIYGAVSAAGATTQCPAVKVIDSRDVVGLEKYVTSNDFKSLDCVIASLPTEVRAFRTYIKKSLSLQEASTKNPRALVGSPDGGFFLTFNGHKDQKGFNTIEFFALDNNKSPNRWVPGTIELIDGKIKVTKDAGKCTHCHGNPVRPIWAKYPDWPNAYGSVDDWMPDEKDLIKGSLLYEIDIQPGSLNGDTGPRLSEVDIKSAIAESRQFREFRKYARTHSRYSALEQASDPNNPVHPFTEVYRLRNEAYRPNLIIGSAMAIRQAEILNKKIKRNVFYQTYKASVLHYYSCPISKKTNEANLAVRALLRDAYQYRYNQQIPDMSIVGDSPSDRVFDILGPLKHERTLFFADGDDYLDDMDQGYFSGFASVVGNAISQNLFDHIQLNWPDSAKFINTSTPDYSIYDDPEIIKQNPHLSVLKSPFFGKELYTFLTKGYLPFNFSHHSQASEEQKNIGKEMCERLELESKQEIEKNPVARHFVRPFGVQQTPWPAALNSCISCHDSKDRVAVAIPFSNPAKLALFSKTYTSSLGYGGLVDAVISYTDKNMSPAHQGGLRMPLGREPLSPQEQTDVISWIKNAIEK